jgi:hypothetical protein
MSSNVNRICGLCGRKVYRITHTIIHRHIRRPESQHPHLTCRREVNNGLAMWKKTFHLSEDADRCRQANVSEPNTSMVKLTSELFLNIPRPIRAHLRTTCHEP